MRTEQHERLGELRLAIMTPAELGIRHVALMAIGEAEVVFARVGQTIELVLRELLGEPVTLIFREVELVGDRMPVHSDDLRPGDPSASGPTGEAIAGGVAPACGTPDPQIRSLALYSGDVLDHCMRKCAHTEQ